MFAPSQEKVWSKMSIDLAIRKAWRRSPFVSLAQFGGILKIPLTISAS